MTTITTDIKSVQDQISECEFELARVREDIEQAQGKAATGGTGLAGGLLAARERALELEKRLVPLRQVRGDLEAQTQHAERERRIAALAALKVDAKRIQPIQDAALAEFEKATAEWLRAFVGLRSVNSQSEAVQGNYRALRREFDPHGPGRLTEQVDFPRLRVGSIEPIPIIRMICRDGFRFSESMTTQVSDAVGGEKR